MSGAPTARSLLVRQDLARPRTAKIPPSLIPSACLPSIHSSLNLHWDNIPLETGKAHSQQTQEGRSAETDGKEAH